MVKAGKRYHHVSARLKVDDFYKGRGILNQTNYIIDLGPGGQKFGPAPRLWSETQLLLKHGRGFIMVLPDLKSPWGSKINLVN